MVNEKGSAEEYGRIADGNKSAFVLRGMFDGILVVVPVIPGSRLMQCHLGCVTSGQRTLYDLFDYRGWL